MPEDCIIEFKSEALALSDAEKRLADEIFTLQTMNQFTRTPEKSTSVETDDTSTADWDGNVPPDVSDTFDFLL